MAAEMSAEQKTTPTTEPATLTIGGGAEESKEKGLGDAAPDTYEIDMHDRDPDHMNDHVKVKFQDIIAEPDDELFSFDNVWQLGYKVFTQTKLWCYRITSLICVIPLAVCWGVYFACLAFCNIWCCVPCLKAETIQFVCCKKLLDVTMNTCCAPCFEAFGRIFSNIRIHVKKEAD